MEQIRASKKHNEGQDSKSGVDSSTIPLNGYHKRWPLSDG